MLRRWSWSVASRASPDRASGVARAFLIGVAFVLASLSSACRSSLPAWSPTQESSYDALQEQDRIRFGGACRALQRGRIDEAQAVLSELARRFPDNIAIGIWLQEAELAAARRDGLDEADALRILATAYRDQAEAGPTPARLVLAARLESDPDQAARLCALAVEVDPNCAWAHYGLAFQSMRAKDWREARAAIARALEVDPGHLRTRRLEAIMFARGGSLDESIEAHEMWLEYARADPTIALSSVREAELDLALLLVLAGDPKRAERLLAAFEPGDVDESRRYAVLAACQQASNEWRAALAAAQQAETLGPEDSLPIVQQALLYEYWLDDPVEAEAAWRRVLEAAADEESLSALLQRMRARVRVERARRAEVERAQRVEPMP